MSPIRLLPSLAAALLISCARPVAPLAEAPPAAATPAPPMSLPRDAGPHDGLTEWWYYTGHLYSENKAHTYGFEFVVFQVRRQGMPTGYLAHFAISDVNGQRFNHSARYVSTDAAGGFPLDVNGWRLDHDGSGDTIDAADFGTALHLHLMDEKPPALHHGGYIDYGPAGGSYYYSRTRLGVSGTLDDAPVHGVAWMDHQWGNFVVTALGGWDWYSLQFDDHTEVMLYVLRSDTGETTGVYGTRVLSDGRVEELGPGSVESVPIGSWTSPHTGATYPSGWRLRLPNGQQIDIRPQLADQELWFPDANLGSVMAYWEGAVTITGDLTGVGYVELTGYAQ